LYVFFLLSISATGCSPLFCEGFHKNNTAS
jgi:hypothetical protein